MASEFDIDAIDSNKVYTLAGLAKALGFKQIRSIRCKLRERGIPIDVWSNRVTLVSGRSIQESVEKYAKPIEDYSKVPEWNKKRPGVRRNEILHLIRKMTINNGQPPTPGEIAQACGLRAACNIMNHLNTLEKQGKITRTPGVARSIKIVEKGR